MTGKPVHWFEIYVQDMPRAKQFYETVFATKLERLDSGDLEMWAFPGGRGEPGSAGALVRMPGVPSGGNSTVVYFTCDNCAIEGSRVDGAGGRLARDKLSIGQYGYIVLAKDPDGNMIGLHSMR